MIDEKDLEILRQHAEDLKYWSLSDDTEGSAQSFNEFCYRVLALSEAGYLGEVIRQPNHMGGPARYLKIRAGRITPLGRMELERYAPPDAETISVVRSKLRQELKRRDRLFGESYRRTTAEFSAAGALHSGRCMLAVRQLVEVELEERGRVALSTWQAILQSLGKVLTKEVATLIQGDVAAAVGDGSAEVRATFLRSPTVSDTKPSEEDFETYAQQAREHLGTEIDFARLGGFMPPVAGTPTGSTIVTDRSINIHGSIVTGNLVSGDGATATMTVDMSRPQRDELAAALLRLRESLEFSHASPEAIATVTETIDEAVAGVQKPKVNRLTLAGLLSGIGGFVQTLAAAPEASKAISTAYQGLKSVAKVHGYELP